MPYKTNHEIIVWHDAFDIVTGQSPFYKQGSPHLNEKIKFLLIHAKNFPVLNTTQKKVTNNTEQTIQEWEVNLKGKYVLF